MKFPIIIDQSIIYPFHQSSLSTKHLRSPRLVLTILLLIPPQNMLKRPQRPHKALSANAHQPHISQGFHVSLPVDVVEQG